jgi:hypothetical protein
MISQKSKKVPLSEIKIGDVIIQQSMDGCYVTGRILGKASEMQPITGYGDDVYHLQEVSGHPCNNYYRCNCLFCTEHPELKLWHQKLPHESVEVWI